MYRLTTTLASGEPGPTKEVLTRQAAIAFIAEFWGGQDSRGGASTWDALTKGEEIMRSIIQHGSHTYQCLSGALLVGEVIEDRPLAPRPSEPVDPGRTRPPRRRAAGVTPVESKSNLLKRLSGFGQ